MTQFVALLPISDRQQSSEYYFLTPETSTLVASIERLDKVNPYVIPQPDYIDVIRASLRRQR